MILGIEHPAVTAQKWEDIQDYSFMSTLCDLCNTTEKVKEGQIPVTSCNITESIIVGRTYWRLCQSCHDQGWEPGKESSHGNIKYFNKKGSYPVAIKTI